MNKQRLLKLADFLAALKESDNKEFDMGTWGTCQLQLVEEAEQLEVDPGACGCKIEKKEVFECRTTACALGWATQIPSFQKAGLKMRWSNQLTEDDSSADGTPEYEGEDNAIIVAQQFFGIDYDAANFIFGGQGNHRTPKETARAIRKFVAKGLRAAREW